MGWFFTKLTITFLFSHDKVMLEQSMVKAFQVEFPENRDLYNFYTSGTQSIAGNPIPDHRPIMVIANDIKEVANTYPKARIIMEHDMKEVVILDSVKIVCPVKHHE